jgi:hypothetical protein
VRVNEKWVESVALVSLSLWVFLLLAAAAIIWSLAALLKPSGKRVHSMLLMGFFLAVFDWFFETGGLLAGFWHSTGSIFALGPTQFFPPIEVFLIALCAGAALDLLFPKKFELRVALPLTMLVAVAGTAIEAVLASAGNLVYLSGWTSAHAFAAYWAAFLLFYWVDANIIRGHAATQKRAGA